MINSQNSKYIWMGSLFIGLVFFFNVQCAVVFLLFPENYVRGFGLAGPAGEGMVQGLGILFLMWNVPYAVALVHPIRYRLSLYEAVVMQFIGLSGEWLVLVTFPPGYGPIQETVRRFIVFDAAGLLALFLAVLVTRMPASTLKHLAVANETSEEPPPGKS